MNSVVFARPHPCTDALMVRLVFFVGITRGIVRVTTAVYFLGLLVAAAPVVACWQVLLQNYLYPKSWC